MFVALGTQHAMRTRRVASLAVQYFSTLFHKQHNLRKNVIEHKMCAFIFYEISSETFPIVRREERDVIRNVYWSLCKVAVILVRLQFLDVFCKNFKILIFLFFWNFDPCR